MRCEDGGRRTYESVPLPQYLEASIKEENRNYYEVRRFVEKPDKQTAQKYLATQNYFWNAGMFIFKTRIIEREIARLLPELKRGIEKLAETKDETEFASIYSELPKISVDFGIMEKAEKIAMIKANFDWDDAGSFDAMRKIHNRQQNLDSHNNFLPDNAIAFNSENCFVLDDDKNELIALCEVEDLIIVRHKGGLLICRAGKSQSVKEITKLLEEKGLENLLYTVLIIGLRI